VQDVAVYLVAVSNTGNHKTAEEHIDNGTEHNGGGNVGKQTEHDHLQSQSEGFLVLGDRQIGRAHV